MIWVLLIFLSGTVQDSIYFDNLDTCLKIAKKIRDQNWSHSLEGDKIWGKAYCVPQKVE